MSSYQVQNFGCNLIYQTNDRNPKKTVVKVGSIVEVEAPIHVSNVMIIDPKTKKPTRIGHSIENNKKIRISKKSNEKFD